MASVHTVRVKFDASQAKREAAQLDNSMDRLDRKAGGMGGTFAKIGGLIAAVGFGLMARDMGQTIVATEKMKASLETMTGSMENANKAFAALTEFATTTPFTVDQSVNAFIKMKALGLEPTEAALTSFGNTASAMGKDMNDMIEAVADASTGEFERLKEFGIKASTQGDQVAFTFQGITTTVGKNAAEITGFLQTIGETQFAGAMEREMARLPGQLSNLRDNVQKLWRALGDSGVTAAFSKIVTTISAGVAHLVMLFETGFAQARISIVLAGWVTAFGRSFDIIGAWWKRTQEEMNKDTAETLADALTFSEAIQRELSLMPFAMEQLIEALFEIIGGFGKAAGQEFMMLAKWAGIGLLEVEHAFENAWELIKFGFTVFAAWVTEQMGIMIEGIVGILPDIAAFDFLRQGLDNVADSLGTVQDAEIALAVSTFLATEAHEDRVKAVKDEIEGHKTKNAVLIKTTGANIWAIFQETSAERERIETQILGTRTLLEAVEAGLTWQQILDQLAAGEATLADEADNKNKKMSAQEKAIAATTKKLQPFLDKINGVTEAERILMDATALVDEAIRVLGLGGLEAGILLDMLVESMTDAADESDLMTKVLERSAERLSDIFGNMWQDFATGADLTFSGIVDGFRAMLGELINEASTQPILLEIKGAIDEERGVDFEALKQPLGTLFGTLGGTALGGGGQGAALGSGLGSLIGGAVGGPLGSFIGGILGGAVGGLFDRETRLELGGVNAAGADPHDTRIQTRLGTLVGLHGQGGVGGFTEEGSQVNVIGKAIQGFDKRIAELLPPAMLDAVMERLKTWRISMEKEGVNTAVALQSRLEAITGVFSEGVQAFVSDGITFEEQMQRFAIAMALLNDMQVNPQLFGERTFEQLILVAEELRDFGDTLEVGLAKLLDALVIGRQAMDALADFADTDLASAFAELMEVEGRTLRDQTLLARDAVRDMANEFDGTLTAAVDLAAGVQHFREVAIATLREIESVSAAVSSRLLGLAQSIDEFINPRTIEDHINTLDKLFLDLAGATDAADIDRITAEIKRVAQLAWNSLPEDMKMAMGQQFIEMLEEADRLAQLRLDLIREQVIEESNILRDQVAVVMEGITDPLMLVANELGIAAEALIAAGVALNPGGEGSGPGFDDPRHPGRGGIGDGRETDNAAISAGLQTASDTLAAEGAAYREATARNTQLLADAIASIPGRIVVHNVIKNSEFVS